MTRAEALIAEARKWIGTTAENNPGQVEAFRKTVFGRACGQNWCLDFVQHCANAVGESELFKTEMVAALWDDSPHSLRIPNPEPGCLAVYYDRSNPMEGHVEIVTQVLTPELNSCVGGNTSPAKIMDRAGRGVWEKERQRNPSVGPLALRGYLRVWTDPQAEATMGPAV